MTMIANTQNIRMNDARNGAFWMTFGHNFESVTGGG